jgi:hypothetical protein
VGYEWLPQGLDALRGIEPSEVMQALGASRRWPVPASGSSGVPVLSVWARTDANRPLIVVLRSAGGLDWLIIGAREMNADEQKTFKQWEVQP